MAVVRRHAASTREPRAVLRQRAMDQFKEAIELAELLATKGVSIRSVQQSLDAAEASLRRREFAEALGHTEQAIALLHAGEQERSRIARLRQEMAALVEDLRVRTGDLRAAGVETGAVEGQIGVLEAALVRVRSVGRIRKLFAAVDVVDRLLERQRVVYEQDLQEQAGCRAALAEVRTNLTISLKRATAELEARLVDQLRIAEEAYAARKWDETRSWIDHLTPTIAEAVQLTTGLQRRLEERLRIATAIAPASSELHGVLPEPALPDCVHVTTIGGGYRITRTGRKALRICKDCGAHFTPDDGFKRMRFSKEVILIAVDLYQRDLSLRAVKSFLAQHHAVTVSEMTILNWVNKYSQPV